MTDYVRCRACGRQVGKFGIGSHYRSHHPELYGKSASARSRQKAISKILSEMKS
jgi:hypothetical protein